ncbi:hypothetical protein AEA09_17140 [Lysinibacillus contaminans]|uniref:Sigma factor regulator C-terminal domain-containing protein n=1 Tax=Lysinibacillus contaminans TaxID=1293441 RepID=A0ABR5JWX6_9BACI|nr:anti sigma factor C-terminal domain-containing protein [Lysinibacillus contaminans]KOS66472.1 hypothetical protein AEA09_17140 [Lysinibacillus contaminans]
MKKSKIDDLFDFENVDTEKMLKEAKGKSYARIILISLSMAIYIFGLIYLEKIQITPFLLDNKISEIDSYYSVYGANTHLGIWDEEYRFIGSSATAPKYKIIDGKPVSLGEVKVPWKVNFNEFSLNSNWPTTDTKDVFTYDGVRKLQFYHPSVTYEEYKNDLSLIAEIPDFKKIEMGISFDKPYTLQEVQNMLPKNVKFQWAWVDIYDETYLQGLKSSDGTPSVVVSEEYAAGFHLYDQVGEAIKNPKEKFVENLELALRNKSDYYNDLKTIDDFLKQENEAINTDNIMIVGAVITGSPKDILSVQHKEYVKAAVLGAVVDKY